MKNVGHISVLRFVALMVFVAVVSHMIEPQNMPSADLYDTMQIDQEMDQLQTKLNNLETPRFPEDKFLSDMSCEYGQFQPETNTIPITLSFQPNTSYSQYQKALLHCNGATIPLSLKDGSFTVTYEANIFETQSISAITFLDHDIKQKKSFSWNINPASHVVPQFFSAAYINTNGTSLDALLKYSGSLHVFVGHFSEEFGGFEEINLIKMLDGKVESSHPIRGQFQNHAHRIFSINKKVHGRVPDGSTLELVIELVDTCGLRYQCVLLRLDSEGKGLWDQLNTTRVYGKDGTFLYQISS